MHIVLEGPSRRGGSAGDAPVSGRRGKAMDRRCRHGPMRGHWRLAKPACSSR